MRTRAAIGGFALAASAGWSLANVGAVADRTAAAYGVGLAVVGLFTTALVVTHAAMQIPAGRLCDRFGARVVGAAGLVVILLASLAGLTVRETWFAILVRLATGFGLAGAFVGGADYVRATLRSPLAQGFYGAVSMASAGLALALVPLWPGWRAPFATAAILSAAGLVLIAAAPAGERRHDAERAARSFDRRLLPLGVMHAASFGLSVVLGNWVATLLEREGGESTHLAGVVGGLVLFLGVISRPLGGRFVDRPAFVRSSFVVGAVGNPAARRRAPACARRRGSRNRGVVGGHPVRGRALGRPAAPARRSGCRRRARQSGGDAGDPGRDAAARADASRCRAAVALASSWRRRCASLRPQAPGTFTRFPRFANSGVGSWQR